MISMWANTGSRRKQMELGGGERGEHVSERHQELLAGLASGSKNNGSQEKDSIKQKILKQNTPWTFTQRT